MPQSPNLLGPSSSSPAQSKTSSNPRDYQDQDDLPSTILETQQTRDLPSQDRFVKFPVLKNDISESTLGQGFIFGPRQAPKPGQYSGGTELNFAGGFKQQPIYNIPQNLSGPTRPSPAASPQLKLPGLGFPALKHDKPLVQPDNTRNFSPEDHIAESTSPMSHDSVRSEHHESQTTLEHGRVFAQPKNRETDPRTRNSIDFARQDQLASSICGDLEAPMPSTPRRHRRETSVRENCPTRSRKNTHRDTDIHHRPRSQSSNISKKRAAVRKPRAHRDSERQKALHHVAEYWNHCMRMAEEDREEASHQIDQLQSHIQLQSRELNQAQNLLKDKHDYVQEMEQRFKELERKGTDFTEQNRDLAAEVNHLREQLSDSNKRATQLGEKYKAYKYKINEAINEQQDLYRKTKSHYEDMMTELRNEESKRASTSQEIEGVLQVSKQKRDDMKKLFQELQNQSACEIQQKNQSIDELKDKLSMSETELARERHVSMNICQQISDRQFSTEQAVDGIAAKVDSLIGLVSTQSAQNHVAGLNTKLQLEQKLDAIMSQISSPVEAARCSLRDEQALQTLENNIVNRMAPTVQGIISRQDQAEQLLCRLGDEFSKELTGFKNVMGLMVQQLGTHQSLDEDIRRSIDNAMQEIGTQVSQTQQSCSGVESQFEVLKKELCEALTEFSSSREANFSKQLGSKDAIIDERDRQLQLLADDYAAKLESMATSLISENSSVNRKILESLAGMALQLDAVFDRERRVSEQKIQESNEANRELQSQLDQARLMLDEAKVAPRLDVNGETNQQLNHEREIVSQLKQSVQQLEENLRIVSTLRGKWKQDIDVIDALKNKIVTACQRLPRVESMAAKLGNIVRLNGIIHSTAKYLSTEKDWIQQEIAARNVEDDANHQDGQVDFAGYDTKVESLHASGTETQQQHGYDTMDIDAFSTESLSQRKVQVRSPEDFDCPSPPPTVAQEQRRRREANKPRSIMRLPFGAEISSMAVAEDTPPADDQKSQPSSSRGAGKTQHNTDQILKQIRSGFIPPEFIPPDRPSWKLPTVTEFQKSFEIKNQNTNVDKEHHSAGNESPGDLKGATIPIHPRTTGQKSRRPVTRMYTRQFSI